MLSSLRMEMGKKLVGNRTITRQDTRQVSLVTELLGLSDSLPPSHTPIYKKGIYWDDVQAADQLIQQWLAVNKKSKNPVVLQSHKAGHHRSSVGAGITKQ